MGENVKEGLPPAQVICARGHMWTSVLDNIFFGIFRHTQFRGTLKIPLL